MALSKVADIAFAVTERGAIPDAIVRAGIRRLIRARLEEIDAGGAEKGAARAEDFVSGMLASPIALVPEKANEQHYEVPAGFFGAKATTLDLFAFLATSELPLATPRQATA